jgi:hypothetical protein
MHPFVLLMRKIFYRRAHTRSQHIQDFFELPRMATSRRRQSAITYHFRGASPQRTTPIHTPSLRATITPGSMPRYQSQALPGIQLQDQHPASPAQPMITSSIESHQESPSSQLCRLRATVLVLTNTMALRIYMAPRSIVLATNTMDP